MTMLSTLSTAASTMLLGAALSGPATANPVATMNHQAHAADKASGKKGDFMRICKTVECTRDQRAELREIGSNYREVVKPLRAKQREIRRELVAAFSSDRLDDRQLAQLYHRLDRVSQRLRTAKRDALEAAHDILSPDQRDDVARILAGAKKRRGKGKSKGKNKGKNKGKSKGKHLAKGHANADTDLEFGSQSPNASDDNPRGKGEAKAHARRGMSKAERKRERRSRKDRRAERLSQPRGSSPPSDSPERDLRPAN